MQRPFQLIFLFMCIFMLGCSALRSPSEVDQHVSTTSEAHRDIVKLFEQQHSEGVILVQQEAHLLRLGNAVQRADQAFVPASTFKVLNALIALQHHKVAPKEIFKWDEQPRAYAHWQKDMNMAEAMQLSTVPVYQEIARRIGKELMQAELKRVQYGNADTGHVIDRFWLDGPLTITPRQSLNFISQLSRSTLPFDADVQHSVRDMLLIERQASYTLYGKTGWGKAEPYDIGWLVGWIETSKGELIPYVLNMQMKEGMNPNIRKELLIESFTKLGLLK